VTYPAEPTRQNLLQILRLHTLLTLVGYTCLFGFAAVRCFRWE
jgi:hypothetical protein